MKKIALFICLIAFLAQVNAQPIKNKLEQAKHKKELVKNLNLTQEQQAKAKEINEKFKQQVKELKANDNLTLGQYKQKVTALKTERKSAFEAMLTANQKAQLVNQKLQLKQERKAVAKAHFDKIKSELQLTKDQEARLREKHKEIRQQATVIKSNNALTQEQKRSELKNLRLSQKEYFKTILTQEQLQKFEQLKKVK